MEPRDGLMMLTQLLKLAKMGIGITGMFRWTYEIVKLGKIK